MPPKQLKTAEKSRGPNWSVEEESELVRAIVKDHKILFGNYSAEIDKQKKKKYWDTVLAKVRKLFLLMIIFAYKLHS